MSTEAATTNSGLDTVKILLAFGVLIGGIVAFYAMPVDNVLIRALAVLAATVLAAVIYVQSSQGATVWQYILSSRTEVRKMVWPSRQETAQTTLVVIVMVIILALFLWMLDWLLLQGTQFFYSLRG